MATESENGEALPAAAIVAINQGRLIEAIKIVRENTAGLGLKEAKERVDAYVGRDPMLKAQLDQQRVGARRKLIKTVLIIDLALAAAIVWYFFGR
jgi:ribosomal protein L7/L12